MEVQNIIDEQLERMKQGNVISIPYLQRKYQLAFGDAADLYHRILAMHAEIYINA